MGDWILDETLPSDQDVIENAIMRSKAFRNKKDNAKNLALGVRINDLIIHDTKKWFGSANIRVDTLVLHGSSNDEATNLFHPKTFHFNGIKDNERLPIEHPGQLIYYGFPSHFLDISILISRDTKDSDDLATLISNASKTDEWTTARDVITTAFQVSPQAALIVGAAESAIMLSNLVYKLVKSVSGNTIGLYRTSWLQYRDRFGIGRHPEKDSRRQKDFSFWYEIVAEMKE